MDQIVVNNRNGFSLLDKEVVLKAQATCRTSRDALTVDKRGTTIEINLVSWNVRELNKSYKHKEFDVFWDKIM